MSTAKTRNPKAKGLDGVPTLVTHREVAKLFCVSTTGLKKWVAKGQFPIPHSTIACTWYFEESMVAHRLRTGEWPEGVTFL